MNTARKRGPRQDGVKVREAILEAARAQFADQGYDGASLRGIAAHAGVDPALVSYYFGSKSGLFLESLRLPVNPATLIDQLLAGDRDALGERLVRTVLTVWDAPASGEPLIAVLRSAMSQPQLMREFVQGQVVPRLAGAIGSPDADVRAGAAASQMLGLLLARYGLRVEPLASAGRDELVALYGPTLQRYLAG